MNITDDFDTLPLRIGFFSRALIACVVRLMEWVSR
jgi:hypothetical protein